MAIPPDHVFRLSLTGVNAYLVDDGAVTLVDAGTPWDADLLEERLADAGYAPSDVDRVLVTHYDPDNVGALAGLALDAPVYAADPDAGYLAGDARPPLLPHKAFLQRLASFVTPAPGLPITRVDDHESIGGFTAYRTPGHTPGHVAYVHRELDVAFVGDMVKEIDGTLRPSSWLTAYDAADNDASIARFVAALAPDGPEAVAVGHGDPIREGGFDVLARLARDRDD